MSILTVSQLNRYVSFRLKEDINLHGILIKGEVSNFTHHLRSGHFYFTLKDETASLKCVMFKNFASKLPFDMYDGMNVILQGNITVYERDGVYQLYATDAQPDGSGKLYTAFEQLKTKLSQEGLFDDRHKRPLPSYPKKIGVVTSANGAALQDIINILSRRYPIGNLHIFPALVQGDEAPASICKAVLKAEMSGCDVLIVGRGGGSFEDLNAFNSEDVAYCVYNCTIPVISAVGHETDFTIIDFVADLRAPTPSGAAELCTASAENLYARLDSLEKSFQTNASNILNGKSGILNEFSTRLNANSPVHYLEIQDKNLYGLCMRLKNAYMNNISEYEKTLGLLALRLDGLSPLKILSRGYSIVYNNDKNIVSNSKSLNIGDNITIKLGNGTLNASVTDISEV